MWDFLGTIGHYIMLPLYYVVSAVLVGFHELFSMVLDPKGGASWTLSIIGLTLVIRAALIPLFVKQIKSSRNMQLIQPKVKELQEKYGHDRERLAQETMQLYKDSGTNPFASCMPLFLQMPIFFALFRLVNLAAKGTGHGFLSDAQAKAFGGSQLFGAIPIKDTFTASEGHPGVMVTAALLVVAMTATTFLTQRQLMSKNMPSSAMSGPYAQQQKMLLYVLPIVFAVGGIAFPIAVLIYWTTSNLWTMGQQFYVIRNNPAPGTPAFEAKQKRDAEKAKKRGAAAGTGEGTSATQTPGAEATEQAEQRRNPRSQPKRESREQRKKRSDGN